MTTATGYLDDVLQLLWPAPLSVVRDTPAGAATAGHYVALPNADRPRLIVPVAPAAVLRRSGAVAAGGPRMRRLAAAAALRSGAARRLGTRLVVTGAGSAPAFDEWLSEVLGRPVHMCVHLGVSRANRKPVVRAVDAAGRAVAFAKIGLNPLTDTLVRTEAAALDRVAASPAGTFRAPALLHRGDWHGHPVVVQAALPIPRRRRAVPPDMMVAAMREIAAAAADAAVPIPATPGWADVRGAVAAHGDGLLAPIADAWPRLESVLGGVETRFGAWHGDWTPWNMALGDEALLVWDWERYADGVPAGFDALHLRFQSLKSTMSRLAALERTRSEASDLLAPWDLTTRAADAVTVAYALTLAARYAADHAAVAATAADYEPSPTLAPLNTFATEWVAAT